MLAGLYVVYVIVLAKLKPNLMPPLSAAERFVPLPPMNEAISKAWSNQALPALLGALKGGRNVDVPTGYILRQLGVALLPLALFLAATGLSWHANTAPPDADARAEPWPSLRPRRIGRQAAACRRRRDHKPTPGSGRPEGAGATAGRRSPSNPKAPAWPSPRRRATA
jgi:hypothetical protein